MQFSTDMDLSRKKPSASLETSGHFKSSFSIENITGENSNCLEKANPNNTKESSSTISIPVINVDKTEDIAHHNLQHSDSDEEFESSDAFHSKLYYSRQTSNQAYEQYNNKIVRYSPELQVFRNKKITSPSSELGSVAYSKNEPTSDSESNSNNGYPTPQSSENPGSTLGFEVPSSSDEGCPIRMFPLPETADSCNEDEEELCGQNYMFGMHNSSYSASFDGESPSSLSSPFNHPEQGKLQPKTRINYYPMQLKKLEETFVQHPYPNKALMNSLSKSLEIPESKIKVWFQNKRARLRRRHPERSIRRPNMLSVAPFMPAMFPYPFMPRGDNMTIFPWINHSNIPTGTCHQSSSHPTTSSNEEDPRQASPLQSTSTSTQQALRMPTFFCPYPYGMYPPYFFGKE